MLRTTIFLDEFLLRRAQRFAQKNGKSFAQVVREAVADYLVQGGARPETSQLPSVTGMIDSGIAEVSESVDDMLWQHYDSL